MPPKKFGTLNKEGSFSISLKTSIGDSVYSDDCANILNIMFTESFSDASNISYPFIESAGYLPMDAILVDPIGIVNILDGLKLSSSSGVDGINTNFLKSTKLYSSLILAKLFEQSLQDGVIPSDWKVGKVIPIPKAGDKHSPHNYRPISFTSIPCKLLQHIIFSPLVIFL